MSWDLYLVSEKCSTCGRGAYSIDLGNYTHNTNPMIRAASLPDETPITQPSIAAEVLFRAQTRGLCWGDWEGQPAGAVGAWAEKIADELEGHSEKYEPMNPDNGWGSREGVIKFIRRVARECREHPGMKFEASG